MSAPFRLRAALEHANVEPGTGTIWGALTIEAQGPSLEAERAPLAVVLVVDRSGSMAGEPLDKVLRSCEAIASHLLGPEDQLAIVAFSTQASILCGLTGADEAGRAQVRASLVGVTAQGNTNLQEGIGVAAAVLQQARAGLRQVIVVLSDGKPTNGLRAPGELAAYVRGLGVAVSSLGFGLHYDENVLDAIATAGSGRYAHINNPSLARVDLARAVLAQAGIVADHLELKLLPAEGVTILRLLPASQPRFRADGFVASIGDVFKDEARTLAVEMHLDLQRNASGRLLEATVEGRSPSGIAHLASALLEVDIRAGARVENPLALRDVLTVQADAARSAAREQADRGARQAAAATLRQMLQRIDALSGFVRNDGSMLAELREQLADEAARQARRLPHQERAYQRKSELAFKSSSPFHQRAARQRPALSAQLVGVAGPVSGHVFVLWTETIIGRSPRCEIAVAHDSVSRNHARLQFLEDHFLLVDLGATGGTLLNGTSVQSARLAHGDLIQLGEAVFRFERGLGSAHQPRIPGV